MERKLVRFTGLILGIMCACVFCGCNRKMDADKYRGQVKCSASEIVFHAGQGEVEVILCVETKDAPVRKITAKKVDSEETSYCNFDAPVPNGSDKNASDGVYTGRIVINTDISVDTYSETYNIQVVFDDQSSLNMSKKISVYNQDNYVFYNVCYVSDYLDEYLLSDEFKEDSEEERYAKTIEILENLENKGYVVSGSIRSNSNETIVYEIDGFQSVVLELSDNSSHQR